MFPIFLITAVLILYGSLYPWQFQPMDFAGGPVVALLSAWPARLGTSTLKDVGINLVLYMPLGASGYLAALKRWPKYLRYAGPIVFAFFLSAGIEMAQLYDATRDTSAVDVVCNVAGATAGVGFAGLAVGWLSLYHPRRSPIIRDWGAVLLILCWVAYLCLAIVPSVHFRSGMQDPVMPRLILADTAALTLSWLVLGILATALVGQRTARYLAAGFLLLLPARLLTAEMIPATASIAAGLLGYLLWFILPDRASTRFAIAALY